MTFDTEAIRNAAGTLDVLTSHLAADNPLRLEASEGAKAAVADLYRIADRVDAQAEEIEGLRAHVALLKTILAQDSRKADDQDAEIKLLSTTLALVAQALAWRVYGECRGFDAPVVSTQEAIDAARNALGES